MKVDREGTGVMDLELWQKVRRIYEEARDRRGEDLQEFLDKACGKDGRLRDEVKGMLANDDGALTGTDTFATPIVRVPEKEMLIPGDRILDGRFEIIEVLKEGGMGVVYLGRRSDGAFEQEVAIKVIRPGLDAEKWFERFRVERQILARLEHPNIARLIDGGETKEWKGSPCLVMEYIDGTPIDQFCKTRELTAQQTLELFLSACKAMIYAHQRLVIHRDIKPSNILVTSGGVVKLLDFGIAKIDDPGPSPRPQPLAEPGDSEPLTWEWASPEQRQGDVVGVASDIFSMGTLLYKMLTGEMPQKEEDPYHFLTRNHLAARKGFGQKGRIRQGLAQDLRAIVSQCRVEEPEDRYKSIDDLSEDLHRALENRPVEARKTEVTYAFRSFLLRRRVPLFLGLIASLLVAWSSIQHRNREALIKETFSSARSVVTEFLFKLVENADPLRSEGPDLSVREYFLESIPALLEPLANAPKEQAELLGEIGGVLIRLGNPDDAVPLLERNLEIRREIFPPSSPWVALSLKNLSEVHLELENLGTALDLGKESLQIYSEQGLVEERLKLLNQIAVIRKKKGDLPKAERAYRDIFEGYLKGTEDKDDEGKAAVLHNLSVLLRERGDLEAAVEAIQHSIQLREDAKGTEHTPLISPYRLLGLYYLDGGQLEAAWENLSRSREIFQATVNEEDHPSFSSIQRTFAAYYGARGEYDEAVRLLQEALSPLQLRLGPDHPRIARVLRDLAIALAETGDLEMAHAKMRESLEMFESTRLTGHWEVADAQAAQAYLFLLAGKARAAEVLLLQSYPALVARKGSSSLQSRRMIRFRSGLGGRVVAPTRTRHTGIPVGHPHGRDGLGLGEGR
ncbi:MAG: serine/threonine-protein kinase [Deltaproteobacteria bacterium]|nr:serine/threonine-protein kinase [Deltaproteobacteria bacterium]